MAAGGLVTAGVTTSVAADRSTSPAGAPAGLTTFEDCDALRKWYVDHAITEVGPFGWRSSRMWTLAGSTRADLVAHGQAVDGAAANADASVAQSDAGTNTQGAGVDEPDVAKTDGRLVVRIVDGRRIVITDVTGASPRQLSEWRLPGGVEADGLLLVGDHVLLAGADNRRVIDNTRIVPGSMAVPPGTQLIDLDISDPAHPRLDSRTSWSGRLLAMRQFGDTVRLVTATGLPALPFVQPGRGRLTPTQAEERNREIVSRSTVEDWLPDLDEQAGAGSGPGPLVRCDHVHHAKGGSGSDTVAVATFAPGAVDEASAVAVTGAGDEVYSSADRLYVTSTEWGTTPGWVGPVPKDQAGTTRTHIHYFALNGSTTRYLASGSIAGSIRDRWSLDR